MSIVLFLAHCVALHQPLYPNLKDSFSTNICVIIKNLARSNLMKVVKIAQMVVES